MKGWPHPFSPAMQCGCSWPAPQRLSALQVMVYPALKGIVVEGANRLPQSVLEGAFQGQAGKPLNFNALGNGISQVNDWYANRGMLGQVRPALRGTRLRGFLHTLPTCWQVACGASASLPAAAQSKRVLQSGAAGALLGGVVHRMVLVLGHL